MDILTLDTAFRPVKYLKYLNLQWTSEYYSCGSFSIQILAKDYLPQMQYIYTKYRRETGIIQKINYEITSQGKFIVLGGFFLEKMLDDRIITPVYQGTGVLENALHTCFSNNQRGLPVYASALHGYPDVLEWEKEHEDMGKAFYELLQTQEMTYRCTFNYTTLSIAFDIYRGLDRTQNQTDNNFVVFSKGFKNLADIKSDIDKSNYKNFAYVGGGDDENKQPITEMVDLTNGGFRKEIHVAATGTRYTPDEQTLAEYKAILHQKGKEKLLDYLEIHNFEVDVSEGAFRYLEDFNLGDKVDIILEELSVALECRIVSAKEVFKEGAHTVTIELGEKKLTEYKKARLF